MKKSFRNRVEYAKLPVKLFVTMLAAASFMIVGPVKAVVIDRVIATVNGEAITLHELQKAELPIFGKVIIPGDDGLKKPEERAKERELLDKIIEERLLLQRASGRGIKVYPDEVEKVIENIKNEQNMSDEMFSRALTQRGLPMPEYMERITRQMTISKLFNAEVRSKIVIPPEEIAVYYREHEQEFTTHERVKIRHILIQKKEADLEIAGAESTAARVASLLNSGADFQEVAQQYSQDSTDHKGDISGYIQKGDTLPELEEIIFNLEEGQISPVVETSMGYHIIKVETREQATTRSMEDVSGEITARLTDQAINVRHREWIKELIKQAVIIILL